MRRNTIILSIIGILFLVYLFLYANEFEIRTRTEFWITLTEFLVALLIFVLLLFLNSKWSVKLIGFIALAVFMMFVLPRTGLWRYSLGNYVSKEKSKYIELADDIDAINEDKLSYISCYENQLSSIPKLNDEQIESIKDKICSSIGNLDCVEVVMQKSKGQYLFVMSRFIDNGYGLLYCKNDIGTNGIFSERINGLQITSVSSIENNWYYVSFT